ncbi:MAG: HDIG domain-containing protein [Candidatus Sumerlaeia bacterium]|nr:HDIG domain-containing protein [Candidatus Sumerlaeia bacterium]
MPFFSLWSRVRSDEDLGTVFRRPKNVARIAAAVVILIALILLSAPQFQIALVHYESGQPMTRTVVAQFSFAVDDPYAHAERVRAAEAAAPNIYVYDPNAAAAVMETVATIIRLAERFERDNEAKPPAQRADYGQLSREILNATQVFISSATLRALAGEIRSVRFAKSLGDLFQQLYKDTVVVEASYYDDWKARRVGIETPTGVAPSVQALDGERALTPDRLDGRIRDYYLPRFYPLSRTPRDTDLLNALKEFIVAVTRMNLVYSKERTLEVQRKQRESVEPVIRQFHRGQTLIAAGQIPTPFELRMLGQYNVHIRGYRILRLIGYLIVILGMFGYLALYARRFRPLLRFRTSSIVLIGLPLLVVLFVGRVASAFLGDRYEEIGYLFPAPLLGMLGVILLDTEIAIILVMIGSVLIGLATTMNFHMMLPALFGGLAAVVSVYRLRQRGELFRTAIHVAAANTAAIAVLRLIEDPTQFYYAAAIWGTLNAALSYLLATGLVPLLESVFGITTDLKLLELTGGHHPLMRELEEKSPGSYQHSLNVAKLAEAAADAIGANYLLVRAGAYFHDIGKTLKPRYFSENQMTPEERRTHEKLTPFLSCLIIRNHVKEGIELARRYGLPERVIDFIPQHHGTCLIKYFYYEAVRQYEESESAEPVREADFRYPGPKPQTIEAAIVMLADSVEAIATSRLTGPNIDANDIQRLVIDAIQDKFTDGQFDECHLTFRQLHEIRESMVRTLLSRFHHRVDYPVAPVTAAPRKGLREAAAA